MNRQRPLLLMLLAVYIFSPTLLGWMMHPEGAWYRPYLLWILVIIIAYIIQARNKADGA